jgi:excisionase family DNA binding protein
MNKEQTAKKLKVSVRTLQRHMKNRRIAFKMRRTDRGEEAVFDNAEVMRFKKAMKDARKMETHSGTVDTPDTPDTHDARVLAEVGSPVMAESPQESVALARVPRAEEAALVLASLTDEHFNKLVARCRRISRVSQPRASTVELSAKHFLTLEEAAALAGLSKEHLSEARKAGKLKAKIIGRGWKIRPKDLQSYTDKL